MSTKNGDDVNYEQLSALIAHLRGLADGSIKPNNPSLGLCQNIAFYFPACMVDVIYHFISWDKFSGDPALPVPHPTMLPVVAYCNLLNLWGDDEYGDNRRDLCRHCADCIEARWFKKDD